MFLCDRAIRGSPPTPTPVNFATKRVGLHHGHRSSVFGGWLPLSGQRYPLEFLFFPLLMWAAFRFGPRETATVHFISSAIAVVGTLHGVGPFAGGSRNEALLRTDWDDGGVRNDHRAS
jgi:hypothetical protein